GADRGPAARPDRPGGGPLRAERRATDDRRAGGGAGPRPRALADDLRRALVPDLRRCGARHGGGPSGGGVSHFGDRMRRGVTWSTLAYLAGRVLSLVALMVLARLLVPADFGAVAAVTAFLALIEFGSDLGMNATVVYEQERGTSARLNVAFTLNLILATILTMVGVLLAPVVAGFFHLSDQADLFRLASLNPVLAALGNIHDSVLLRDMEF